MQAEVERVYVDPALIEHAVRLVDATRNLHVVGLSQLARYIDYGASPRASINLSWPAGRWHTCGGVTMSLPQDLRELALDVLRHRLVLSYEALSDEMTADIVLNRVLAAVPAPDIALQRAVRL